MRTSAIGPRRRARAEARRRGFSLLEMMAVVAIIALFFAVAFPRLGVVRNAAMRGAAREVAATLEYARQRAVMTGVPHRVWISLDEGFYQVEWFVDENQGSEPLPAPEPDLRGDGPLPLAAPRVGFREYRPLPGTFGREAWLPEPLIFGVLLTSEGEVDRGDVAIVFQRDGTSDPATLSIEDEDGRFIDLEVRPLLDVVRIRDIEDPA